MTRNRAEASAEQGRQQAAGSRTQNARARVTNTNPDIHRNTDLWISSLPAKRRQDRSHVGGDPEGKQMLTNIQPSQNHRGTIYPSLPVRALTLQLAWESSQPQQSLCHPQVTSVCFVLMTPGTKARQLWGNRSKLSLGGSSSAPQAAHSLPHLESA